MSRRIRSLFSSALVLLFISLVAACGGDGGGGGDAPPPTPAPAITSFSPTSGQPGSSVTLTGTGFTGVNSVTFGGVPANTFTVNGSTQIVATVPLTAVTGTISVTSPAGTGTSSSSFTVLPLVPTITAFNPTMGPVGTNVIIEGTNFTPTSTVTFNGHAAAVSYISDTELNAVVPSAATSGAITVNNGSGQVSSSTFTVTVGAATLDLFVDGWYITQSSQSYDRAVPLVANRDGYLRVFVRATEVNTAVPSVRVTLNGGTPATLSTPSGIDSSNGVPTSIGEGDLTKSWGMSVPGSSISSGMTVKIEVDPGTLVPESDDTNNVVNATPSVQTAKVFYANIVPVVQSGLTGRVDTDGRTLANWVGRFQRMYPVRNMPEGIDVVKGSTYTFSGSLAADGTGWSTLLGEIDAKRTAESSTRYYYGAVNVAYGSGIAGLGYVGHPVAIGWDKTGYSDGGNYPEVYAHEVGHNLNRWHAPCGDPDPSSLDPSWPTGAAYSGGSIGVYGYDVANNLLKSPSTYLDIMSYCSPLWVSDYTYKAIMSYRASSPIGDVVSAPRECLLVWGRVENGEVILEPAFRIVATPRLPEPGSHTVELLDAQGNTLAETSFEPTAIADLPGRTVKHFAFALPLEGSNGSVLAGLRVLEKGALKAVRRSSGAAAKMVGVREPVSMRMRAGEAHLSWDPMAHPKVLVRDPRTGEVLSFAEGGSLDVVTDTADLDVTFSDGVNSTRKLLNVQ